MFDISLLGDMDLAIKYNDMHIGTKNWLVLGNICDIKSKMAILNPKWQYQIKNGNIFNDYAIVFVKKC